MKPENTFIASVHKYLPPEVYHMKNNNLYNGGIADCWYSGKDGDLWVEYKFIVLPKRHTTAIQFGPLFTELQIEWLAGRHAEGRNVAAIIGCKEGGVILQKHGWVGRMSPPYFRQSMSTRKELAEWIGAICYRRTKR